MLSPPPGEDAIIDLWHGAQKLEERHRGHLAHERPAQDTSRFLLRGDAVRRRFRDGVESAERDVCLGEQQLEPAVSWPVRGELLEPIRDVGGLAGGERSGCVLDEQGRVSLDVGVVGEGGTELDGESAGADGAKKTLKRLRKK